VKTRNGEKFSAEYLIIAAPPSASKKITFEPPLSRERRFIVDRYIMGAYSKMILLYDKPYWRQKGFSG
jgi:monoamine oxidase